MQRPHQHPTPWAVTGRSVVALLLWVPGAVLLVAAVVALVLSVVGLGVALLRAVLPAVEAVASAHRALAQGTLGRPVPVVELVRDPPGGPAPVWTRLLDVDTRGLGAVPASGDLWETGVEPFRQGWRWLQAADTWRLLGWLAYAVTGGALLSALVVLLAPAAVAALVLAVVLPTAAGLPVGWVPALLAAGAAAGWTWWRHGAGLGRARARADAALLSPGSQALLAQRVRDLAESRSRTVDHAAAELRRVERDLHDGAQARLVSLALTLGMVDELLDTDPQAARTLLDEARGTTSAALQDLRSLVQGIHPPVLADRGLSGAVEALALDLAVPVTLTDRLPGRPPAPVESALYFAVAESLANVVKHAGATRAWVGLEVDDDALRVTVGDDGAGGADPSRGTGLRGVATRLSAFDGTMRVDSPTGGPTVITLELPCAWSWPKTSPSSATA